MSFISVGPGTQLFVMRGVSDGSNPTYSNSSATGFFVDDMSMSWIGVQPDLHLYDIERIEVLNGPQGTTFGAGSMAGAIRYITNKPDVNSFSAGVDFDAGKIEGGQENWTYEGFLNVPLISGFLGLRLSAFSDSQGGFINNQLVTRNWVNGTQSRQLTLGARQLQPPAHRGRSGRAQGALRATDWSATLTYSYQRQSTLGAWDQDPALAPRTVQRFGPESHDFQAKTLDFHLEGDVGIGDLVFASTYWSLPTRQQNEYSQYMENYLGGAREGLTCLDDPVYGSAYVGLQCAAAVLRVPHQPGALVGRAAPGLQARRTLPLARRTLLGEDHRQELRQYVLHARASSSRAPSFSTTTPLQHAARLELAAAWHLVRLHDALRLPSDHRVRQHQLRYHRQAERRSGRGALPLRLHLLQPRTRSSRTHRPRPGWRSAARTSGTASSASTTSSPTTPWCTPTSPRASETAAATRASPTSATPTACRKAMCPTRSTTTSSAGKPPVSTAACCGTAPPTSWTGRSCRRSSTTSTSVPRAAST